MYATDIADKVLEQIRVGGPARAKQIADALNVDRTLVNQALYGPLRGKVVQGKDYTWSLAGTSTEVRRNTPTPTAAKNSHASLFEYYLDCLFEDDNSGVRTVANPKRDLDYCELEEWPLETAKSNFESEPLRKLVARQRRDAREKALWLGYPVRMSQSRGQNAADGAIIEPLLIWPQDTDAESLSFLPEPMINLRALESFLGSGSLQDQAAELANELGLDAAEPPLLDELVARLRDVRPEWDWKEDLVPAPFRPLGSLRQITGTGIFNAAVAVLVDRSRFTLGLERELAKLETVSNADLVGSSLGTFLKGTGSSLPVDGPLLEPVPLNAEQQDAVLRALTEPLTVVTGPPGTGKSQVVTAILVNAAWRGLRVLFASKNNKAVDVVMERMNALSSRPIMLRLGKRSVQERLAQHITAILSARPTDDERHTYESILRTLKEQGATLTHLTNQVEDVIKLRNRVDHLERAAERARQIVSEARFHDIAKLPIANAERCVSELREALRRSKRENASFLQKLVWVQDTQDRRVEVQAEKVSASLAPLGFQNRKEASPDQIL